MGPTIIIWLLNLGMILPGHINSTLDNTPEDILVITEDTVVIKGDKTDPRKIDASKITNWELIEEATTYDPITKEFK